jgi:hypothetical protein
MRIMADVCHAHDMPATNQTNRKRAKVRKNILLSLDAVTAGEILAKRDRRSLSNFIEGLVLRESVSLASTARAEKEVGA